MRATLACALCALLVCRAGTPCCPARPGDPPRLSLLTGWRLCAMDGAHAALRMCACAGSPAACLSHAGGAALAAGGALGPYCLRSLLGAL
jgi:hypothetical protein